MDANQLIEKTTARLLSFYTLELERAENTNDYCSTFTAAMVFAYLARAEFMSSLLKDMDKEISAEEICKEIDILAIDIAKGIQDRVSRKVENPKILH